MIVGGSASDEIYPRGLVPVGTVVPYSGLLNELTDEWLYCDGKKIRPGLYPELYNIIGTQNGRVENQKYYADIKVIGTRVLPFTDEDGNQAGGVGKNIVDILVKGGNRELKAPPTEPNTSQGDLVKIVVFSKITNSKVTERDARVYSTNGNYELSLALRERVNNNDVQGGNTRAQFATFINQAAQRPDDFSIRLYGRHRRDFLSSWGTVLIPDLRNRTVFGAGSGNNSNDNGSMMSVGDVLHTLEYSIEGGLVVPVIKSPAAGSYVSGDKNPNVSIGFENTIGGGGDLIPLSSPGGEYECGSCLPDPQGTFGCGTADCVDPATDCPTQPCCACINCIKNGCQGTVWATNSCEPYNSWTKTCIGCDECKQGGIFCSECSAQGWIGSPPSDPFGNINCAWMKDNIYQPTGPTGCTGCGCCDNVRPCYRIDGIYDCVGCSGCLGCTGCGSTGSYRQYGNRLYSPAVVTYWIIRAKPSVNALILTGHNHDDRYVRHDMQPQKELHTDSGMTAQRRANARYNIQALSRETGDTHYSPVFGGGLTFAGMGKYRFFAGSATSQGAYVEVENPYGWSKVTVGGASGGMLDLGSPFAANAGVTTESYDLRLMGGLTNQDSAVVVAGANKDLQLMVEGMTGVYRHWGVYIAGGSGNSGGMVGIRTDKPTMSLEVRGSGIKIRPHVFDGNTTGDAPAWNTVPTQGMFMGGMFNSTGLTTLNADLTLNSDLFPETPKAVYTVDPGTGISIVVGKTITVASGFTWKIL